MLSNEKNKTELNSYPIFLIAVEISEILRISKPSAYALMDRKDFPLIKIGRSKRVRRDLFILWLTNHNENTDSPPS